MAAICLMDRRGFMRVCSLTFNLVFMTFLVVFGLMAGFLVLLLLVEMWRCLCFLIREALRICFGMLQMDMDDLETFELFVYLYLYILALAVKIIIIRQEDLNDFNPSHHLI